MKTVKSARAVMLGVMTVAALLLLSVVVAQAQSVSLKINFVATDEKILIYAGQAEGVQVGQTYDVMRSGAKIGVLQITEVKSAYSVARVVSSTGPVQEMDQLVLSADGAVVQKKPAAGAADSGKAEAKPAAAEKKEEAKPAASGGRSRGGAAEAKKEEPAAAKTETSSRRRSTAAGSSEKTETAAASGGDASAAPAASGGRRGRGASGASASSDAAPADSAEAKPAAGEKADAGKGSKSGKKKLTDPRETTFFTAEGFSGVWTIPTADVLEPGRYGVSYYKESQSQSDVKYINDLWNNYNAYSMTSMSTDSSAMSISYGAAKNVEIAIAQHKTDTTGLTMQGGRPTPLSLSDKGTSFGVKYQVTRVPKYMMTKTSNKKWKFAAAASRTKQNHGGGRSSFYGMVNMPTQKFDFHAGIFQENFSGVVGSRLGTMAAVEFPISTEFLFIGETKLAKGDYSWNAAVRYVNSGGMGSAVFGFTDLFDGNKGKSLGVSMKF